MFKGGGVFFGDRGINWEGHLYMFNMGGGGVVYSEKEGIF